MARKPVLEGGKKDEIIEAALDLFLEKGYDTVSVRMILKQVGGEVGMFYHYFKSKEEIFEAAADRFFHRYTESIKNALEQIDSLDGDFTVLFDLFTANLSQYKNMIHDGFHWSVRLSFHILTLESILPHAADLLERLKNSGVIRPAVECSSRELAGYLIFGARGIMHEKPLTTLSDNEINEKLQKIKELTSYILRPARP